MARGSASRRSRHRHARSRAVGRHERDPRRTRSSAGAARAHVIDAREEFARDFVLPSLKAGALSDTRYPMATALTRPLIAKTLVQIAAIENAAHVAHGAIGRDRRRLAQPISTLNPDAEGNRVRGGDRLRREGSATRTRGQSHRRQPVGPHHRPPRRRRIAGAGRGAVQGHARASTRRRRSPRTSRSNSSAAPPSASTA